MYTNLSTGALGVRASFEEAVDLAARHGFRGIDFSIVEVEELVKTRGLDHVRHRLNDAGVRLGGWGVPVRGKGTEAEWREGLAALPERAQLAVELGSDRALTGIMPGDNERDFDANYAFHQQRLLPVAETLAANGCRLGIEFIGPKTLRDTFTYPFLYTMKQVLDFGRSLETGNVGLLVDLFHLFTGHTPVEAVRDLDNRDVVAVHINDGLSGRTADEQMDLERALPGETGVTDIVGFLQALAAIDYDGPVTVEPFSARLEAMEPEDRVRETVEAMQKCWQAAGLTWA